MKWIAKRDFLRTPELQDITLTGACEGASKDAPHADHIHEGALFEYGTAKDEAQLRDPKFRDPKRELIAQLRYSGCIGDASDEIVVRKVVENVKLNKAREATAAKLAAAADNSGMIQAFTRLLEKAAAAKA